jgi:hypothetical protein
MWHDSWASLLAHNLATPCLGCEPKVKVVTLLFMDGNPYCDKIEHVITWGGVQKNKIPCCVNNHPTFVRNGNSNSKYQDLINLRGILKTHEPT